MVSTCSAVTWRRQRPTLAARRGGTDVLEAQRGLQDVLRSRLPGQFLARYETTGQSDALSYYLEGEHESRIRIGPALFRKSLRAQAANPWATAGLAYLAYSRGDLFGRSRPTRGDYSGTRSASFVSSWGISSSS